MGKTLPRTRTTANMDVIDTIDLSDYPVSQCNKNKTSTAAYNKELCKDNKDFTIFLNNCILLEQSQEMEQIVQGILLPAYTNADDGYKTSEKFARVIKKAMQRLIDEPMKKYSHISDVTDTLKLHVKKAPKKRVNFHTLSTTTSVFGKSNEDKRKRVIADKISQKRIKKPKMDVIALDSEDDVDFIAIAKTVKEKSGNRIINRINRIMNGKAKKTVDHFIAVNDESDITDDDDIPAVGLKVKKKLDHLLTVHGKTKKTDDNDFIAVDDEAETTVDGDFIAVNDETETTVDGDFIAVNNETETTVDDDFIAVDDEAETDDDDLPAVDLKVKKTGKCDNDTAMDDVIVVEGKANDVKIDKSVTTTKPKLENNNKTKIKTKASLKLKKSKHHATTVEPEDESNKNTPIQIDTKLKESKEKTTPNGSLDVENNNTTIEILDSQEIRGEDMEIDNNERNTVVNVDGPNFKDNEGIQNDKENLEANENNKLLVPRMEITYAEKKPNDSEKYERIKAIEAEILKYKKKISDLEEAEVTEDSAESAYVRCDRLQAHIVKLYKELCTLNEVEPVKGRQVTLELTNGQTEGPLKRLERFLNKTVDEDGVAPFPDYADVVRCVEKSNVKDGLGWSKGKVHKEAQALFEYCGRALQKRRQRRAWRDLRSKFSREDFDADPAADDAELAAKLALNKQLALQKEAEILEDCRERKKYNICQPPPHSWISTRFTSSRGIIRFTQKESSLSQSEKVSIPQNTVKNRQIRRPDTDESDTSSSDEEDTKAETEKPESNIPEKFQANVEPSEVIRIKEEPYEVPVENLFKGDISVVIKISDSDSSDSDDFDSWSQRI